MSIQAAALYALVGVTGAGQSVRDLQNVSNQVNRTQGVMAGLGKSAGQMATGMTQVGKGLLRIGEWTALAAAGAIGASAKVGTSFQAMTELIHTQAGASQGEVDKMRVAIEGMVHDVGTAPIELAKGLYHIESVGVRGSAALDILRASALGAKVGLADMESVTNALTAVWFSGIKGAKSMTDAMAILDGIVGVGNMHLQDLTDSFRSGILGTSATYGVDIRSLGAAIATLTDAGVPADIAATRLNNTLTHLAAPTKQAIGVLKDLGLGQFTLAKDLHKPDGIFAALQDLHDHLVKVGEIKDGALTPKGAADMSKLFGGSRFGATAMQLLVQMDRVQQKYDLITERSNTFAGNVQKTMETAGFKWGQFKADIENAALAFSDGFLPALARAGSHLDRFLLGHTADIRRLGVQLGQWLDKIDWNQVEKGANDFLGVLKQALEIISKVPPQVDAAIVGFLALNKLSGGLLGVGVGNIVGGAAKGVESIAAGVLRGLVVKVPGVGGAIASVTAVHVFVDNWPPGFGLGGIPLGAAGAGAGAGAAGLGIGAISLGLLAGVTTSVIGIMGLGWLINATSTPAQQAQAAQNVIDANRYKRTFGGVVGPPTPSPRLPGDGSDARGMAGTLLMAAFNRVGGILNSGDHPGRDGTLDRLASLAGAASKAQQHALDQLHRDFLEAIGVLRKPDATPAEIRKMSKQLADAALKGVGNVKHTAEAIDLLRSKLAHADPATARVIRAAITALEPKLTNRQFVARQLALAQASLRKNESSDAHIADLTRIQRTLLQRGDTHAANKITAEIRAEKKKVADAAKAAGHEAAEATRNKEWTLNQTFKWIIDGRDLHSSVIRQSQFDRSSAGPGR